MGIGNRIGAASVLAAAAVASGQQTTVFLTQQTPLTEADLLAGMYRFAPFTLGPDLRFFVQSMSRIDPIGSVGDAVTPDRPIDFAGTLVDVFGNGVLESVGVYQNARIRARPGARLGSLRLLDGVNLTIDTDAQSGFTTVAGPLYLGTDSIADIRGGFMSVTVDGGQVEISGGEASSLTAIDGTLTLSGGQYGSEFDIAAPTIFEAFDFRVNTAPVSGAVPASGAGDVLSGVWENGEPFVIEIGASGAVLAGVASVVSIPSPTPQPPVINAESGSVQLPGLWGGTELNLRNGVVTPSSFVILDSTLNIEAGGFPIGGTLGNSATLYNSTLNLSSGLILNDATVIRGQNTISGGSVSRGARFVGGTTLLSGGTMTSPIFGGGAVLDVTGGTVLDATFFDSNVRISGGVDHSVIADAGSVVTFDGNATFEERGSQSVPITARAGSTVGGPLLSPRDVEAEEGSAVTYQGGEFAISLVPLDQVVDPQGSFGPLDAFTGTLADGSVFVTTDPPRASESFIDVALPPAPPTVVITSNGTRVSGVRQGQDVTLAAGVNLREDFGVVGGSLTINAGGTFEGLTSFRGDVTLNNGIIRENALFIDSDFHMTGGELRGASFRGSRVVIEGGQSRISAVNDSDVTIRDARVGIGTNGGRVRFENAIVRNFSRITGSDVEVSGIFGGRDFRLSGCTVEVRGGPIARGLDSSFLLFNSPMNFHAVSATLDGEPISGSVGEVVPVNYTIGERLEVEFADGTSTEFFFDSTAGASTTWTNSTVSITFVASPFEPTDFNEDGVVNISDLFAFITAFTMSPPDARTDFDGSGVVNISDLFAFITAFTASP